MCREMLIAIPEPSIGSRGRLTDELIVMSHPVLMVDCKEWEPLLIPSFRRLDP